MPSLAFCPSSSRYGNRFVLAKHLTEFKECWIPRFSATYLYTQSHFQCNPACRHSCAHPRCWNIAHFHHSCAGLLHTHHALENERTMGCSSSFKIHRSFLMREVVVSDNLAMSTWNNGVIRLCVFNTYFYVRNVLEHNSTFINGELPSLHFSHRLHGSRKHLSKNWLTY